MTQVREGAELNRWLFFLGTHEVSWLGRGIGPLFVSHRRLAQRAKLPRATARWALDSGGFTELSLHGQWITTVEEYIEAVRRYAQEIGRLEWAAPMDWMCEPAVLARTGLTVEDHQRRTVENLLELRALAPDLPFVPVLQGWTHSDYEQCLMLYQAEGIDLTRERLVGLGSICRRQAMNEVAQITWSLAESGIALHGFGVKSGGLTKFAGALVSADSMAWSYRARREDPLPGCQHRSCSNCMHYALRWRTRLLGSIHPQLRLQLTPASAGPPGLGGGHEDEGAHLNAAG